MLPGWFVYLSFVAGAGSAILGARRVGLGLMTPALLRWLIFPLARPFVGDLPVWVLLLVAAVLIPFGAVRLLQGGVGRVYGRRVGDLVAATYLVRMIDWLALAALRVLLTPVRLTAFLLRRFRV